MAWELKIKSTKQNGDTLVVTTEYYEDSVLVETVDVPLFRPKTYDDVLTGIKNRAQTIKDKADAVNLITKTVKPDTDKELNKLIPTPVQAVALEDTGA